MGVWFSCFPWDVGLPPQPVLTGGGLGLWGEKGLSGPCLLKACRPPNDGPGIQFPVAAGLRGLPQSHSDELSLPVSGADRPFC